MFDTILKDRNTMIIIGVIVVIALMYGVHYYTKQTMADDYHTMVRKSKQHRVPDPPDLEDVGYDGPINQHHGAQHDNDSYYDPYQNHGAHPQVSACSNGSCDIGRNVQHHDGPNASNDHYSGDMDVNGDGGIEGMSNGHNYESF